MRKKKVNAALMVLTITVTTLFSELGNVLSVKASGTQTGTSDVKVAGFADDTSSLGIELYARYNSGVQSADGGSMEIVEYNEANGYAYAVSGVKGQIVAIPIKGVKSGEKVADLEGKEFNVKELVENQGVEGFTYGDVTSVAISPDGTMLAASVQHSDYDKEGVAAIFTCNADGTLTLNKLVPVGVQPDMITFVDDNIVLTADEGEPRNGYGNDTVDPKGTVSIVDINEGTSEQAGFDGFTADDLAKEGIIVGVANGEAIAPVYDMEPEYIAVSADKKRAYVALQEANAIGVLDIENAKFTGIYSTGYEDFSTVPVDLVKDGKYDAKTYDNLVGARMPDGIAVYSDNGFDYLVTANEGDSREWGTKGTENYYCNENKTKEFTSEKITILDKDLCKGLPEGKSVMFGGRGFTVFKICEDGLTPIYDSGSDFEKITAQYLPDYFNASNDDIVADSRSAKKGPEPENVTIGKVNGRTYAFVTVERIGGVMVYDVTNPSETSFVNYINSRDFSDKIKGDVSPEGICFIADNGNGVPVIAASCEVSGTVAFYELKNDIVVLYTNDVHNAYEQTFDKNGNLTCLGYASVAQYKKDMERAGNFVELVDAGDAIQGGVIGALSQGEYLVDIMNQTGYSIGVLGNHEFDFGMDQFLKLAEEKAKYDYVSCNFIDLRTKEPVFDSYKMKTYGDVDVAYIGITTPETYTKSTPTYFQDENGNYIYGFCEGNNGKELYDQVQNAIDDAKEAGAEYVVAIGHAGVDPSSSPWTSKEIIANTTGLDAFIDGHSHSTIVSENCTDKDGNTVVLSSTGTKLASLGKMVIKANGTITTELVTDYTDQDEETLKFVNEITDKFKAIKEKVVAKTAVDLVINDPVSGKRMVRNQETNLGDLCADAYRKILGADIAFVNGGGVRVDVKKGDVTYGDVINVHPFGNMACLIEATGQQILDALELGASVTGIGEGAGESGGFLQVSGLTYDIDTTIPSSVVKSDKGEFVKVDGEYRVKNVMVGDEPLDLKKTYTLASHNYMLKSGGDGFTMFKGNKILKDEVMVDNEVLINYIKNTLGGNISADSIYANPYGEGRIHVITAYKAATKTEDGYVEYLQGDTTVRNVLKAVGDNTSGTGDTGIVGKPEWKEDSNGWWYDNGDGTYAQNEWKEINGKWYFFDNAGYMVTGWTKDGDKWYYLDEDGAMKTGWIIDEGKWYYLDGNGAMKTGWIEDGDKWYYLEGNGAMKTGWIEDGDKWYYLDENGVMTTGWAKDGDKWYYLDENSIIKTGWIKDNDNWYYLDESGAMKTGWVKDGDKWYYLDESGVMKTGWVKDGDKWYYLDESGAMTTGWAKDGDKWYYLDENSIIKTGWIKDNDNWYYLDESGVMKTGWVKDGDKWYYLDESGAMKTGWVKDVDEWYYLDESGAMKTGWVKDNDNWYYLEDSGVMASNKWVGNYYLQEDGSMAVSKMIGIYYVGEDGAWIETM